MNESNKDNENNSQDQQPETEQTTDTLKEEAVQDIEPMPEETQNQPEVVTTKSSSGGKGIAGTALFTSLLALGVSGYNWYGAQNSTLNVSKDSQQNIAATDYSEQIAALQTQVKSLSESQQPVKPIPVENQTKDLVERNDSGINNELVDEPTPFEVEDLAKAQAKTDQASSTAQKNAAESQQPQTSIIKAEQAEQSKLDLTDSSIDKQVSEATVPTTVSSDEIKQLAKQEIDLLVLGAKKRLNLQEVEQLLALSDQRLALATDFQGAVSALNLANKQLAAMAEPLTEPLQTVLTNNIQVLNSVEVVNINELVGQLGTLMQEMDDLPFKPVQSLLDQSQADADVEQSGFSENNDRSVSNEALDQTETSAANEKDTAVSEEDAESVFKKYGSKFTSKLSQITEDIAVDLKSMVRVQKTGSLQDVVLAPEQQYFVRENIKLMLGAAQRAALQSNTGVFKQNLSQAKTLISDHYDVSHATVEKAQLSISELEKLNLKPKIPDLENPSRLLDAIFDEISTQ